MQKKAGTAANENVYSGRNCARPGNINLMREEDKKRQNKKEDNNEGLEIIQNPEGEKTTK